MLTRIWSLSSILAGSAAMAASQEYMSLPIAARTHNRDVGGPRRRIGLKVHDVLSETLVNEFYYYTAEIEVGTPPQKLEVQVDTGSSDLWVMLGENPYCNATSEQIKNGTRPDCQSLIVYEPERSSTFHNTSKPFDIRYGDFSYAKGEWAIDTVRLGGVAIENATFATAREANSTLIVMGIGFTQDEAMATHEQDGAFAPTYDNLPALLKQQGHIASVAYSLWLNTASASTGSLLLGAVDHTKYTGALTLLPIVNLAAPRTKTPYSMVVMLHGVANVGPDGHDEQLIESSYPVLLDSGTSFAYLPKPIVEVLAETLGFALHQDLGVYAGSCRSLRSLAGGKFTFQMSGANFSVPYEAVTARLDDDASSNTCTLLVLPSASQFSTILGDIFLRSVYAVYDLDRFQIALAPSRDDTGDSNIEEIRTGIPRATTAASYSSTIIQSVLTVYQPRADPPTSSLVTLHEPTRAPVSSSSAATVVTSTTTVTVNN